MIIMIRKINRLESIFNKSKRDLCHPSEINILGGISITPLISILQNSSIVQSVNCQ